MKDPENLIYDVIVENFRCNRPARIFIRFERETPTRVARNILEIVDAIDHQPIDDEPSSNQYNQIEEAIEMLVWAAQNDPDPVNPKLRDFLKTI